MITNTQAFLKVQEQWGRFSHYIWHFVDGQPVSNPWTTLAEIPSTTALSAAVSKDLKQKGFKFVGSTICYAFMQAIGLVNDHLVHCPCKF